jgi:lipoate-protein ligase A
VELNETIQPFILAFQVEHGISFMESGLTGEEKCLAESLVVSKYGSPEWNERI